MMPTVLVAESDADLRDVYQRYLSQRGYAVETASTGLECVEKLRRAGAAVVVLERELLWGGGDGVLARLREEGALWGPRVVLIVTGGPACEDAAPVFRVLSKPFPLAALLEAVSGALRGGACPREQSTARACPCV